MDQRDEAIRGLLELWRESDDDSACEYGAPRVTTADILAQIRDEPWYPAVEAAVRGKFIARAYEPLGDATIDPVIVGSLKPFQPFIVETRREWSALFECQECHAGSVRASALEGELALGCPCDNCGSTFTVGCTEEETPCPPAPDAPPPPPT